LRPTEAKAPPQCIVFFFYKNQAVVGIPHVRLKSSYER
jgi:hypothetical protein